MDRLIWTAWRAFWVGLGASAVLIGQTLLAPAPSASTAPEPDLLPAPHRRAAPVVSRTLADAPGDLAPASRARSPWSFRNES